MFGKKFNAMPSFPVAEFGDRLDALIAAASNAGLSADAITEKLEAAAKVLQISAAINWVHGSVPPTYARVGGDGNVVARLTAALRGE
jgi:hypothetical protein